LLQQSSQGLSEKSSALLDSDMCLSGTKLCLFAAAKRVDAT